MNCRQSAEGEHGRMTYREQVHAILHYEPYDRMPVVHFGYWSETLIKWAEQGYLSMDLATEWNDGNAADSEIAQKLGFDFNWNMCFGGSNKLLPHFESKILETYPDGKQKIVNSDGNICMIKPGDVSIPGQIGTLMTGREAWEELYKPRLQYTEERINMEQLKELKAKDAEREIPTCIHCGSLYGAIRDMIGVTDLAYLQADDEDLYDEIIETMAELCFQTAERILSVYDGFDYGHFWEDICFKNGPLLSPHVFRAKVAPGYRRITGLLKEHGIDIVSLDCDGCIDKLVPIWLENGVNTMFPIEVGVWEASIRPWREQYGNNLRGVGGMDKRVFAQDRSAVDREIDRLKKLIDLGGYIPCPDHRIAPDAEWDLVRYYCDRMHDLKL